MVPSQISLEMLKMISNFQLTTGVAVMYGHVVDESENNLS